MSQTPARTLARGHRNQSWLAIALVGSTILNIGVPVYFWTTSKIRDQVVVFDLASGSLLLSPLVDPSDSQEILNTLATWGARCILDRSAAGLDNDTLIGVLFNTETGRKVRDEFSGVRQQYIEKNLRSHVEIKSIDAQTISSGVIKARVIGEVVITGTLHEQAIQEVQPVVLDLSLARNPDLARVHRYPLLVWSYSYADSALAKK